MTPLLRCAIVRFARFAIDGSAQPILDKRFGASGAPILNDIWANVTVHWSEVAKQTTIGAAITVRLASITIAAYRTLLPHVASPSEATRIVYDIAWSVYAKMGSFAWWSASVVSSKAASRMRLATTMFRTFPFSSPSYVWKDVTVSEAAAAFDCLRCPVATHFKEQGLSELCVSTWCALDFPLAEKWHGKLERASSIAAGAEHCDFRWFTRHSS